MEGDQLVACKAAAKAGSPPPSDAHLIKGYTAYEIKAADGGGERALSFTITTGAVDRDGDTISPDGWDVEAYMKNPVVLWAHMSRTPPIGRALSITRVASALKATAEFMPPDLNPMADMAFRMLKGGWLKAVSVGFLPTEWSYDETRGGVNFLKQTLLEFSVCPVPSNPEALLDAKHAGIDLAPLKSWAEQTLDAMSDEPGLWLPKSVAEKALRIVEPKASVTVPAAPEPEVKAAVSLADLQPKFVMPCTPADLADVVKTSVRAAVGAEIRRHTGRLD